MASTLNDAQAIGTEMTAEHAEISDGCGLLATANWMSCRD